MEAVDAGAGVEAIRSPGVERIFMGWDRPALVSAADILIDRHVAGGEARMGGAVVVVPGARAGRRLLELLLDTAGTTGVRLIPPRIITTGQLPDYLYERDEPLAGQVLCRRAWIRALRSVAPEHLETVFPELPSPDDLAGWNALAAEIERVHRELGGAGLRFADVAARFSDPTLAGDASGIFAGFDDGARWTALAYVQREYEATLEAVGRADAELARMDALRAGAIAAEHPVWLVGVSEMPPVTHALVRAAAALGTPIHALVHAPAERAGDFDAEGCIRSDVWAIAPVPLGDEQLAIRDSPADQAGHVVGLLAGLDGAWPADQISVAVPDAELVPYLEQALGSAGVPVRYAAGRAISRTGPYRLLEAMAEYLAGERFDAFTTLLRHPDVAAWLRRHGESAAGAPVDPDASIADADAYHTERLPARFSPPRRRTQGARRPLERARDALIGPGETALLAPLRGGKRSLAEWSPLVLDVLVRAYGDRPLIRDRPGDRPILEACERIRDVAAGYHRLPQPLDEECDAATAIRLILADVARLDVPPAPDAAAVELLGWLELHLDDAPVKVVTGVYEPFLPESAHGDALLPDRLRGALGLVDNRGRRARDAYRLTALLHSTAVTHVVAGRRDARGDPLRPSRLMLALEGRPLAERVRRFYGEAPGETLPAGAAPALVAAGTPPAPAVSAFVLPPEPTIVLPSPVRRLNVSAFRALLRDPYMFALEYVYGLETVDDSARELDPLGFGSLAHEVLQAFAAFEEVDGVDSAAARHRLDNLLDSAARAKFGRNVLPAVDVQVEQLRARLHAFADWHAAWIADGWRVVAVEGRVREPGGGRADDEGIAAGTRSIDIEFPVDGEPFTIRGRIDRIDYHAGRRTWAVFDYKTSDTAVSPESAHRKKDGTWVDLQLPLYRHLLAGVRTGDGDPLIVDAHASVLLGYINLSRDLERTGAAIAEWSADDLASADETARAAIRLVRAGRFRYDPATAGRYDGALAALMGQGRMSELDDEAEDDE